MGIRKKLCIGFMALASVALAGNAKGNLAEVKQGKLPGQLELIAEQESTKADKSEKPKISGWVYSAHGQNANTDTLLVSAKHKNVKIEGGVDARGNNDKRITTSIGGNIGNIGLGFVKSKQNDSVLKEARIDYVNGKVRVGVGGGNIDNNKFFHIGGDLETKNYGGTLTLEEQEGLNLIGSGYFQKGNHIVQALVSTDDLYQILIGKVGDSFGYRARLTFKDGKISVLADGSTNYHLNAKRIREMGDDDRNLASEIIPPFQAANPRTGTIRIVVPEIGRLGDGLLFRLSGEIHPDFDPKFLAGYKEEHGFFAGLKIAKKPGVFAGWGYKDGNVYVQFDKDSAEGGLSFKF